MPPKRKRSSDGPSGGAKLTQYRAKKRARVSARPRVNPMTRPVKRVLQRQTVYIGRGPIARESVVWLKYVEAIESSNAALDFVWRLNSIFDPNRTGTGHQPMGHDQYAVLYNRYRVTDVTVVVSGALDSTLTSAPHRITFLADNLATAYTSWATMAEQSGATHYIITPNSPFRIVKRYHLASITGVDNKAYLDDRFQSLFGTNPAEDISLHLATSLADGSAAVAAGVKYSVSLYMKTHVFDPLVLNQS